ncbi:drug/metabolite exporter YedA [Labrys miyagiensis]|uniref:Drug/metabolite exporter YedA n=1 Tax=Labrys miyagiensis TaxID=346912 RepID=A0ABQ6CP50_9HYPH|nr:EamA family transporter [Labrys miyagiensis]GLS22123.1 drug/metabolite exporter YedA [Labrys miyagiensis]
MPNRNLLLFLALCAIWETTWIGIKAGVEAVPPLLFAGTRFITAGAILLVISWLGEGLPRIAVADLPRLAATSLLMITLCYAALFWGMVHVDSGTGAVLEMSLTPVALMGFALALGEEGFDRRRLGALLLGIVGLVILFGPTAWQSWSSNRGEAAGLRLLGAGAVASAAVSYGWGSVIARPLLRLYPSALIAASTTLMGGAILLGLSLAFEPGAIAALAGRWGAAAWAGWLFLVLFGSLLGYTIYMRLLRDIGATRAGSYAFVSPVIAVLLGMVSFGEQVRLPDIIGMSIMLTAAGLAMFEGKQKVIANTVGSG